MATVICDQVCCSVLSQSIIAQSSRAIIVAGELLSSASPAQCLLSPLKLSEQWLGQVIGILARRAVGSQGHTVRERLGPAVTI